MNDNDVLNVIGGYVKQDTERTIGEENDFEQTDFIINTLTQVQMNKFNIGEVLYSQLFKNVAQLFSAQAD
jgi:hypothetical protein